MNGGIPVLVLVPQDGRLVAYWHPIWLAMKAEQLAYLVWAHTLVAQTRTQNLLAEARLRRDVAEWERELTIEVP